MAAAARMTMARNARRLGQLIDQLLDLSRLEAGRLPVKWQRGDYLAFLRALVMSFDSFAGTRGVRMETNIPVEAGDGWFDADIVEKIVTNLMSNAFKFTPEGGTVLIGVSVSPETVLTRVPRMGRSSVEGSRHGNARRVQITVSNTGSYIPPAERKRIFNRFHEVSPSGGTGIGLSLVKELVDWMYGDVSVDSDPQSGTRFQVVLPVFTEAPVAELAEAEGMLAGAGESLTYEPADTDGAEGGEEETVEDAPMILVVEDHLDLRSYLRHELSPDFRVLEAENGRAGFEKAVAEIPDLVLSDVMMPETDGFELCEKLKEDERTSHIPVILLTARVEAESRKKGLRTGADDYIAKPFNAEELKLRANNLIEQRRKLAERFARTVAILAPNAMPVTSADERFLVRTREVIEAHLDDTDFRVEHLCEEVAMSRAQLHRKLKALTGKSTSEFVRTHRIQRAAQLLKGGYGNVTEVALAVGFQNLSYFSKSFRAQYGVLPSDYPQRRR